MTTTTTTTTTTARKVLLCGGGNAIHVLSSYIGAKRSDWQVNILSLFPGEAERLRQSLPPPQSTAEQTEEDGICCINDLGPPVYGRPSLITDDPKLAAAGDDDDDNNGVAVVILALPSFTHEQYLRALKPYLPAGIVLGAMPGEGGFDLCARYVLGDDWVNASYLFALETLPWACRIVDYGKTVEVLGTKKEIDVVISGSHQDIDDDQKKDQPWSSVDDVLSLLQELVGPFPKMVLASNFLAVTLMNINSVWHPTISYAFYKHRDLTEPFDEPPLFYQGATELTGELLDLVSTEVLNVGRALQERYPSLDLQSLHHVRDWMLRSYGNDIGDTTNIYTMLLTNKGYRGLTHPMREVVPQVAVEGGMEPTATTTMNNNKKQYLPNFQYRYFTEDIPCGLVVTRGIAALVNVDTPTMDQVIVWCQNCMNQEYLVWDATADKYELTGKDVPSTRCPQRYGIHDLDTFMTKNRYCEDNNSVSK